MITKHSWIQQFIFVSFFLTSLSTSAQTTYWWNETVFYEVFVRSFYDSNGDGIGDLKGLTQKLDYLNDGNPNTNSDLGVTGIWLMPINPSPNYHGYDITNYYGIESDYGTMADFQTFLNEAHKRGIKVIIDMVMNFTSSQHPWFVDAVSSKTSAHRDWYRFSPTNPGYNGTWGQPVWHSSATGYYYGVFWDQMPDLNYQNQAVKDEMLKVATYWLKDIGVDGLRCDAVKYLIEEGTILQNTTSTISFWNEFKTHIKSIKPNAMTVAEVWDDTNVVKKYTGGFDYCFEFNLADVMISSVNTGTISGLKSHVQNVYNTYTFLQWGSFLSNHDITRVFTQLGTNVPKSKLASSVLLTLPGIPFIYYGEEIGMTGAKSSGDESLRTPMQWTAVAKSGFTTGNPWLAINSNYTANNVATEQSDDNSLYNHYKKLIKLRTQLAPLQKGKYLEVSSSNSNVYGYLREYNGKAVMVVHNFSSSSLSSVTFSLSSSNVASGNYLNAELMNRTNIQPITINASGGFLNYNPGITLDARSSYIIEFNKTLGIDEHEKILPTVFPNPFYDKVFIEGIEQGSDYKIFNANGYLVSSGLIVDKESIDLSPLNLASGIYLLKIRKENASQTIKLIKN